MYLKCGNVNIAHKLFEYRFNEILCHGMQSLLNMSKVGLLTPPINCLKECFNEMLCYEMSLLLVIPRMSTNKTLVFILYIFHWI
jgi:hypothetical protein